MRIALFLGLAITISACALQTPPATRAVNCTVNREMARRLENPRKDPGYISSDSKIIRDRHPELVMREKGKLLSRTGKWELDLHYKVTEMAENNDIILLESGPKVWGMMPGDTMLIVLRKRDGYILRWARVKGRVDTGLLDGDAYFYLDRNGTAHCISLSAERN